MGDFYGTIEDANAYHAARGNAAWAAATDSPDDAREAALLRASVWLDGTYRARFPGSRTGGRSQMRQWPRMDATDAEGEEIADDEVPVEILNAVYEAALRELASPGSLSPDYVQSDRVTMEQVGELQVQYAAGAGNATDVRPVLTIIADILAPLIGTPRPVYFGSVARA